MAAVRGRPSGLPGFGVPRFANPRTAATLFAWRRSEAVFFIWPRELQHGRKLSNSHTFTRHNLHLHALLLQNQPWFSARDLGRLLRIYLNDRQVRKLDPDQFQYSKILIHDRIENALLISESGVYALLVYHYCPEYRGLREWLTHEVVPALRDAPLPTSTERPILSLLNWPEMTLSLLHWNNQPWIRLQDVPHLLIDHQPPRDTVNISWWKRATRILQTL